MSHPVRSLIALLLLVLFACTSGCSKPPQRRKPPDSGKQDSPIETALDTLQRASTTPGYREGLNLLNTQISKDDRDRLALSASAREVLLKRYQLEEEELREVEAASFSLLDAHHVEAAYQMREIKRFLEQKELSALDQAIRCFEWVCRQVELQERTDDLIPPPVVLRLGQGTAAERVLVFLALMRQFQLDGCVVGLPGERAEQPGPLVAGVLIGPEKKADIYLFDPRLGRALPGAGGKGVATLAQVRKDPSLFWPAGKPAEMKGDVTVFVAPPLSSLSPRMRYLEMFAADRPGIADRHAVYVAQDPEELLARVEAVAGGAVRVWNWTAPAGGAPPVTPLRVLRAFLPAAEGGSDRSRRFDLAQVRLYVSATVLRNYVDMELIGSRDLAKQAQDKLIEMTQELFLKYAQAGREFLVRGQLGQLRQRLQILEDPLASLELDIDKARLEEWRQRVNQSLLRKQAPNQAVWWAEDRFLLGLLEGRADLDRNDIRELTIIVLRAIRDPMAQELAYLHAQAEQEEAERLTWQAGKRGKTLGHLEWRQAENRWKNCVGRFRLDGVALDSRVVGLRQLLRQRQAQALLLGLDQLLADLHKSCSARWFLARALSEVGKPAEAIKELQFLVAQISALEESAKRDYEGGNGSDAKKKDGADSRNETLGKIVRDTASFGATPLWQQRFSSFNKDLGPAGGFAWLRRAAELELRDRKK